MREPIRPIAFVPRGEKDLATILVRTSGPDAAANAIRIRKLVSQFQPDLRVTNIVPQSEIVRGHTIRERLLATLSLFFGLAGERFFRTLLFEVETTDPRLLVTPFVTIFAAAILAAIPPVLRAARTDPATALRSE